MSTDQVQPTPPWGERITGTVRPRSKSGAPRPFLLLSRNLGAGWWQSTSFDPELWQLILALEHEELLAGLYHLTILGILPDYLDDTWPTIRWLDGKVTLRVLCVRFHGDDGPMVQMVIRSRNPEEWHEDIIYGDGR